MILIENPPKSNYGMPICQSFKIAKLKGSQQQDDLVQFSLFREKRKKHKNWQFSNYVDFSCINEQDMFENSEFRRFCNDSTALSEKYLILAISFLQQGTYISKFHKT